MSRFVLEIECLTGPLVNKKTLAALRRAVKASQTLEELSKLIDAIPTLATYRGSRHVAVHRSVEGGLGSVRLAIIFEPVFVDHGDMHYPGCGHDLVRDA